MRKLVPSLLVLTALSAVALAQLIPGAPTGAKNVRWFSGPTEVDVFQDAGFLYPSTSSTLQGTFVVNLDAGTQLVAGPVELGFARSCDIKILVQGGSGSLAAVGSFQPQTSNDGLTWTACGSPQAFQVDGGAAKAFDFNVDATSCAAPLVEIATSSSSAGGTASATAFTK